MAEPLLSGPASQAAELASGPGGRHVPVMLERCRQLLAPALAPGGLVVDLTVGLAGHSAALLQEFPSAHLIGLDRDPNALEVAAARLRRFGDRVDLVHAVYDQLPEVLQGAGLPVRGAAVAVLGDLGVSSLQLDTVDRGFAYARDAPLDMRMDPTAGARAADVLNTYSADDLARVLRVYGEERFARRIAEAVVEQRRDSPFTTSARLVDLVRDCVPAATRRTGGHPAKRTFQALRIEVNGELDALRAGLPTWLDALAVGGRMVVLAFQSLEDRLVKNAFAAACSGTTPPGLPVELPELAPQARLLTRGAEQADAAQVAENPRAASVRLRALERVRPPAPPPDRARDVRPGRSRGPAAGAPA